MTQKNSKIEPTDTLSVLPKNLNTENHLHDGNSGQFEIIPIDEIVKRSLWNIDAAYRSYLNISGITTGFCGIDNITCGFKRSELIVIAGRPGMGKTSFALNIAQNSASYPKSNSKVAFFSLEMSEEQLVTRMLCRQSKIDGQTLRRGALQDTDWPQLSEAAAIISELTIYIDDSPTINVAEIHAKSQSLKKDKGLDMVIVDYLQLLCGAGENREREMAGIMRALKAMAKKLDVPVVVLSQLNRSVESRKNKRPQLSDLRESRAIEQDADLIMFIYRDEFYNKNNPENKHQAEILVKKQRNGPVGVVDMMFYGEFTSFYDTDEHPRQAENELAEMESGYFNANFDVADDEPLPI